MPELTNDQAHHIAIIAEAKDHLHLVAPNLRGGLSRYLELGIEPGQFLCAVLDNDLSGAVGRASDFYTLHGLCSWLYNHAPAPAWGSKEKRLAWQQRVSALAAAQPEEHPQEPHDTEPPSAEESEAAQ